LDVFFNGTEGSFFVADFVEMKNAVARATEGDIVTRLRENCDTSDCVNVRSIALVKCDNCDAADEIERLRTLVRELQSETHRLEKLINYGQ
jgi:hypothetical protein